MIFCYNIEQSLSCYFFFLVEFQTIVSLYAVQTISKVSCKFSYHYCYLVPNYFKITIELLSNTWLSFRFTNNKNHTGRFIRIKNNDNSMTLSTW